MSIESKIDALTVAINNLVQVIGAAQAMTPAAVVSTPVVAAPAPVTAPAPVVAAPAPVAPPMPTPSMFAPPVAAPAPAPTTAPFTDGAGLVGYVMAKYKELGPQKGAMIQNVLVQLGVQNVNDVKPEQYQSFFLGVEAIQ